MKNKSLYFNFYILHDSSSGKSLIEMCGGHLTSPQKNESVSHNVLSYGNGILKKSSEIELIKEFFEQKYNENRGFIDSYIIDNNSVQTITAMFLMLKAYIYELLSYDILFLQKNQKNKVNMNDMLITWSTNVIENGRLLRDMESEKIISPEPFSSNRDENNVINSNTIKVDNLLFGSLPPELYNLIIENLKEVELDDLDEIKNKLDIKKEFAFYEQVFGFVSCNEDYSMNNFYCEMYDICNSRPIQKTNPHKIVFSIDINGLFMTCNRPGFKKFESGCNYCITVKEKLMEYSTHVQELLQDIRKSMTHEFEYCVEIELDLKLENPYAKNDCPLKNLQPAYNYLRPINLYEKIKREIMAECRINEERKQEILTPDYLKCLREVELIFCENFIKRLDEYISCSRKNSNENE